MTKVFHINEFEGPLDLLLHLVRTAKMDIYEINTNQIIEEYLDYIHQMESLNIELASEYLVMASELVHLKSRLLINKKEEEEPTDEFSITSEEDLKNKLIEYERYKKITEELKVLEEKRNEVFTKLPENISKYSEGTPLKAGEFTVEDLIAALKIFQERQDLIKPLSTKITKKEITVEQRVKRIHEILAKNKKVNFLELFETITNEYVIVTFLAILEMSKNNEVLITQEDNFSPILIEKRV